MFSGTSYKLKLCRVHTRKTSSEEWENVTLLQTFFLTFTKAFQAACLDMKDAYFEEEI